MPKTAKIKKYIEETGRRKTSVAIVRLEKGQKSFTVNKKPVTEYFQLKDLGNIAESGLSAADETFSVSVSVRGGGIKSQAEAIRQGIAKALVSFNPELRKKLKHLGFLTRDSRMRERKKFGLKRARRAPQWRKR